MMLFNVKTQGIALALLSAFTLSFEWYFARKLQELHIPTESFLMGMSVIAVLILATFQPKNCFRRIPKNQQGLLLLRNTLSAGMFLFFFFTVQNTEVYKALLLWNLYVFPVAVAAVFIFGEQWSLVKTFALVISVVGFFLVFYDGNSIGVLDFQFADGIGVLASLCFAGVVLCDRKTTGISTTQRVFSQFIFTSIAFLLLSLLNNVQLSAILQLEALLWMLCLAITSAVLVEMFRMEAIRRIELSTVAILLYSEIIFSGILAWLIAGETLSTLQIIGGVAILSGVIIASKNTNALED